MKVNDRLKEIEVGLDGLVHESQVVNAVQVKDDLKWLIKLVRELEEEKYQDPRQGMLEDLHAENERSKERVEELEEESKNKTELLGEIFLHHHWLKVGGISDKKFMNFMDEVSQKIYELNEIGGEDENE